MRSRKSHVPRDQRSGASPDGSESGYDLVGGRRMETTWRLEHLGCFDATIDRVHGGYSSAAERLTVAQDVVGSIPTSRPKLTLYITHRSLRDPQDLRRAISTTQRSFGASPPLPSRVQVRESGRTLRVGIRRTLKGWKRCDSPIFVSGTLNRKFARQTMGQWKWEAARAIAREPEFSVRWTTDPSPVSSKLLATPERLSIEEAIEAFPAKCKGQEIQPATLSKYRIFTNQLGIYC